MHVKGDPSPGAELTLTGIAHAGEALGRREGKVVFVAGGIPGERVRAEVIEERPRYARARLVKVLEPSPDRVPPRCDHRAQTGTCSWEHIAYPRQLQLKRQIVLEQLTHIGRLEEPLVEPALGMEDPWRYRNHAELQVDEAGRAGYLSPETGAVEPLSGCHLLHPSLEGLLGELELEATGLERLILRVGVNTGDRLVGLVSAEGEPAAEVDRDVSLVWLTPGRPPLCLVGRPHLTERLLDREFRISPTSFFQVNTVMAELTAEAILTAASLEGTETVLDAYSGVGTFACFLAREAAEVVAIESHPQAVQDALANAGDLENLSIHEGTVEELLAEAEGELDLALLDPPRGGVERSALDALKRLRPPRVLYLSCDPATLARDLRRLTQGGYRHLWTRPIDMFPQTPHIESLTALELR